jgi:hypothetical protein
MEVWMRFLVLISALFIISSFSCLKALTLADLTLKASCGYNLAQQYGTSKQAEDYKVETGLFHGATTGLSLELPVTPDFTFCYELNYVIKGSNQTISFNEIDGEPMVKPASMDAHYRLDYIEFPMLAKFKLLKGAGFNLSLTAGVAMALKVNGDYRLKGTIYFPVADSFTAIPITDNSKLKDVNQFDYSLISGGEIDFAVAGQPLTLGYRFTIGWDYLNLPTYSPGGAAPVQLRNQSYAFYLSVPLYQYPKKDKQ